MMVNFTILKTASIPDVHDHYLEISEINGDITTKVMKKTKAPNYFEIAMQKDGMCIDTIWDEYVETRRKEENTEVSMERSEPDDLS